MRAPVVCELLDAIHGNVQSAPPPQRAPLEMTTGSVLIVDDEPGMRELLRRWLQPLHYGVFEAGDSATALEMLQRHSIGVVLCNYSLPRNVGDWLIGEIRIAFPDVAVVLATADDAVPPRITLSRNVVGYLVKPFNKSLLLSAVHDALLWHNTARKQRQ